jgi:hypothetical protein
MFETDLKRNRERHKFIMGIPSVVLLVLVGTLLVMSRHVVQMRIEGSSRACKLTIVRTIILTGI